MCGHIKPISHQPVQAARPIARQAHRSLVPPPLSPLLSLARSLPPKLSSVGTMRCRVGVPCAQGDRSKPWPSTPWDHAEVTPDGYTQSRKVALLPCFPLKQLAPWLTAEDSHLDACHRRELGSVQAVRLQTNDPVWVACSASTPSTHSFRTRPCSVHAGLPAVDIWHLPAGLHSTGIHLVSGGGG
jgi:hypothetical protein